MSSKLKALGCTNNRITSLNLGGLPMLRGLECYNNQLVTLDLSSNSNLQNLNVEHNQLQYLFLKNGMINWLQGFEFIDNNFKYICIDDKFKDRVYNELYIYGFRNFEINSYCSFNPGGEYYTIKGDSKIDNNNDGCDLNDLACPNLKLNITDYINTGVFVSNSTGNYTIPVQAGTHTITLN